MKGGLVVATPGVETGDAPREGRYIGPSLARELRQLFFPEVLFALVIGVLLQGIGGLPGHVWGALAFAGVAVALALLAGPTILREARWDDTGVEFRWLYGSFHFYTWDELCGIRRPGRWSEKFGSGLIVATTRKETITVDWRGENYEAFARALLARVSIAGSAGEAET
jgi:hypothetical protein